MGFKTEKEYQDFKKSIVDFLWNEVDPLADEIDSTEVFPKEELFPRFREKGMWGLIIPDQYGGMGLTVTQYLPILSELAKVSGALRAIIHVHNTSTRAIVVYGKEEQKKRLLPKIATGELSVAFAITEANSGTGRDCKSTAVRQGDTYILNGEKHLITNSDFTKLFMVLCYTNKELGAKGMSALLVDRDAPGFTNERMRPLMGIRGSGHGILTFKDCPIPAENIVGEEGQGLEVFLGELEASRVFVAASSLGVAERALELSLDYAKQRVTFGKPIAIRERVREYLADMAIDIYAMRLMLRDVAPKIDKGIPAPIEASACKVFSAEAVCRVTDNAMLVFGGRSYTRTYPIERLYRDARINILEEGTPTIQKLVIARELLSGTLP